MKINNHLTPRDIKLLELINSTLTVSEFNLFIAFNDHYGTLPSDDYCKLMRDSHPVLYSKLVFIGGIINGSSKI